MTRLSNHLPRVGALVLSAVVALVAYSVHAGQSNVPAEQTALGWRRMPASPGLSPALKLEEGGQPGRRARCSPPCPAGAEASTRRQAPAAAPEGPAGVRLLSAPGFQPVAAHAPPSQPRAPRPRRDGHGGSPREPRRPARRPLGATQARTRRPENDPDPLSEVFEPLDMPAPPETPAAPTPETVPAPPAMPASPSPVPQVPAGEDVDVDETPVDEPEDEPVDEPDAVPPPPREPPPASVDPDDQTGNADDEDAGEDEQSGEAEDESPDPPGASEGADAGEDEP